MERSTHQTRPALALIGASVLALLMSTLPGVTSGRASVAAGERPNIVMFYLDDLSPHDARLWSNPALTPNLYHYFVEHGIRFTNAIGESPLCCPGRASLLTGLHTHNNGVFRNNIHFLHPTNIVATDLRDAGYSTYWLGKYLNVFERVAPADWKAYVKPWTQMEATYYFSDRVRTAAGWKHTNMHPTRYITSKAAELINNMPADAPPFFAVVAPYNTHAPNTPMPMAPEIFAQCDSIPPWNPPNYNEADVSDKPLYVRNTAMSASSGYSLVKHCKEMFGVDALVGAVTTALANTGRLDNTLLVFTADNGMNWGAHRLGAKSTPYATAVPMYVSWPARWGTDPRDIDETVTNIDWGPTICEIAGCALGPYASGQSTADGSSMLPLVDGDVTDMGRDALLETIGGQTDNMQAWNAVRTTSSSPLGLWHYIEYVNGERELYDLAADRWELENLAGHVDRAVVQAALATRLNELLQEGRVNAPDLSVWLTGPGVLHGYNLFGADPAQQTERVTGLPAGVTRDFSLQLENNATYADTLTLHAIATDRPALGIAFLVNGVDETANLMGPGYVVSYAGAERRTFTLRVTVSSTARRKVTRYMTITAQSAANSANDVVQLIVGR